MPVDLRELQGNVLCGYGFAQAGHLFCRIEDAEAARAWLAVLAGCVTNAEPWPVPRARALNVAFSYGGLEAVGLREDALAELPEEFRAGMASRAGRLRDTGLDAPEHWQDCLNDRDTHLLVSVHVRGARPAQLSEAIAGLLPPPGIRLLATERTALLPHGREHFGYGDGLAQPAIADAVAGPHHGHGTPQGAEAGGLESWAPIAPGEFVLGYLDEDGVEPGEKRSLHADATFMVVRKLQQHVAAWEQQLLRWAGGDPELAERLGAQVVGRWKNGTPVSTHPDGPDAGLDGDPAPLTPAERHRRFALLNDFRFADDPGGARCPLGAHVRRANPRDALGDGRLTRRHRLVRRGMPYGPAATDEERKDDSSSPERGLFFVCYQASIAHQFELVQGDWLADGDPFGLGAQADALMSAGAPEGHMLVPGPEGARPRLLTRFARTVTLRGGGYFMVPSVSGLRALSHGA